jgi:uncharacterized lipoprotein YmbA
MKHRLVTLACLMCAALAAGCASSPPTRFYTLSATASPAAAASTLSIAVGPVSVPTIVDREEIVVSKSANEVYLDELHRWAAPLSEALARAVADNLFALLGTPRVSLFPQKAAADAAYRVAIEVQRFESMPGTSVRLDATWTVRQMAEGKSRTGRTDVTEASTGAGYDAVAAAHSRAAERLSRDIGEAIRSFER